MVAQRYTSSTRSAAPEPTLGGVKFVGCLLALVLLSACTAQLPNGEFACTQRTDCPDGWYCRHSPQGAQLCYRDPPQTAGMTPLSPNAAPDAGGAETPAGAGPILAGTNDAGASSPMSQAPDAGASSPMSRAPDAGTHPGSTRCIVGTSKVGGCTL